MTSDDLNELNAKQIKAIIALANGDTIDAAAAKAQCSERTIDVWLKQPLFRQALRDAISEMYEGAIAASVRHSTSAINVLGDIITAAPGKASNRDRIAAARELLANASKWRDWQLEERVTKLERLLANDNRQ